MEGWRFATDLNNFDWSKQFTILWQYFLQSFIFNKTWHIRCGYVLKGQIEEALRNKYCKSEINTTYHLQNLFSTCLISHTPPHYTALHSLGSSSHAPDSKQ